MEAVETSWLVEGLIPSGQLVLVLAQAGVGKSLLVESLAVHMVYGLPFCGFKTDSGDVLLIDQDTPDNVLTKRLLQFSKGLGDRKHKLFLESMNGYTLDNGSLITMINDYPTANLTIIDSLHSICGRLNPNSTSDMSILAKVKSKCINNHRTVIINHHISQHTNPTLNSLMLDMTGNLAMGNSAIMQQADTYYIVGATTEEGRTNRLFIRPVSKRVSIAMRPLILNIMNNDSGGETVEYGGYYEPDLTDVELDIVTLFREQELERTAKEVYEDMGHKYGENKVREALCALETKGLLLMSRHKANLFRYKLP